MGIFAVSTDETKAYLSDRDFISAFALGTSKSPSAFLVAEVVRNHCHSPKVVLNIGDKACSEGMKTTSLCGAECLIEGLFQILMLFGIIWNKANTPHIEREDLP